MRQTIKLREQSPELPERKLRLRLPGTLAADLELYARLYAEEHGHEIALPDLVQAIVEHFLESDRAFGRHKRSRATALQTADPPGQLDP